MERSVVLDELAKRITQIQLDHPVRVAIDGVDAAGKTILADELVSWPIHLSFSTVEPVYFV